MGEINTHAGPHQFLQTLRTHVLGPLSTAESIVTQEWTEVAAEREAFKAFAANVADLPATSTPSSLLLSETVIGETPSHRADDIRQAYRETVMAVPHYDDEYGESLEVNLEAEFGPALAELCHPTRGVSFTIQHKDALRGAAEQSATQRAVFSESLEAERDSLRSLRQDLVSLLDSLDTSIVPAWYSDQFDDQVEHILRTRQAMINRRSPMTNRDGHTLCAYLYADESWRYPVLTAVGRLLDSVVLPECD